MFSIMCSKKKFSNAYTLKSKNTYSRNPNTDMDLKSYRSIWHLKLEAKFLKLETLESFN